VTGIRAFVCGTGIVSAAGPGTEANWDGLRRGTPRLAPLALFPAAHRPPLCVGEVRGVPGIDGLPRTHALAWAAASEAVSGTALVPDAIVVGTTTGGMPTTEVLLKKGEARPEAYRYHAVGSVAAWLALRLSCRGPVITVSTACSSGTTALKIALELIRCGRARVVLAGGADALCRMTYYGFHALQLIDPEGARPLDRDRRGLSVAEGAAFVLLVAAPSPPAEALAELAGAGLSCDAHHPAAPHPEGAGALAAMRSALADAGLTAAGIDYINLHGTGTIDNDLAEARAVRALCGGNPPAVSSVKGLFGHTLGASGAVEAVVSAFAIARGFVPANVGCRVPDPALGLAPERDGQDRPVRSVLSNSFGFGGNNASLVLTAPRPAGTPAPPRPPVRFSVLGCSCLTGVGALDETAARFARGASFAGRPDLAAVRTDVSGGGLRRLKRLSRMTLLLALAVRHGAPEADAPGAIFFGTAWGSLTDTHDFLDKLFSSDERFTSPTDFIGSVHNAPASHAAIFFRAVGPNVVVSGGDQSFEQALYAASLVLREGDPPALVIGAEEHHDVLSPRFDAGDGTDGGAAFLLRPLRAAAGPSLAPLHFAFNPPGEDGLPALIESLGGRERIRERFGAVFAGLPGASRTGGEPLLARFLAETAFPGPVIDYRRLTGEFAAASAVAAALAVVAVRDGALPPPPAGGTDGALNGKGILLLGLGEAIAAVEVSAA